MNAKHTTGPWSVEYRFKGQSGISITCESEDGHGRAEVAHIPYEMPSNARLIAAAPDLLAALESIATQPMSNDWAREFAKAAIAKATAE